jgi:RNA recognition motif-containing protein
MAKKLYVGGISYGSNDDALRDHFSQAGNVVSATIIMDRMTGRSKGFGFVEMSTDEEAANAIDMLNGKELDGRQLSISEARPMTERPPRREGNGGGGYNRGGDRGGNSRW